MAQLQPSPGPWLFRANGDANSYSILQADGNWLFSLLHNGEQMPAQQLVNMQLVAASRDLLDACKEFVRKVEAGEARSIRSYAQMKAAIAKVEGQ